MQEVAENIKHKYTFSGHESFQCRHLWLKKGYDFIKNKNLFTNEDAVVTLGVGKNMVSSLKYWMKCFDIIDKNEDNSCLHYVSNLDYKRKTSR